MPRKPEALLLLTSIPVLNNPSCANEDPELWFPKWGGKVDTALAICASCPDMNPCREFGIEHAEQLYGIWGGLMPGERRRMRQARRKTKSKAQL